MSVESFCQRLVESKDEHGFHLGYFECSHQAKYLVTYLDHSNKKKTEAVCKRHFNAMVQRSKTLKRKYSIDTKIKFKEIA